MKYASILVSTCALLFAGCGAAFLFSPEGAGSFVSESESTGSLFVQLFGAALLGLAAANWIARRSPLGGIYGRAVVAGSQAFSLVGALVMLKSVPPDAGVGFWMLFALLVCSAVLYSLLLFTSASKEHV